MTKEIGLQNCQGRKQIVLILACMCLMMTWIDWLFSFEFLSKKQQHDQLNHSNNVVQIVGFQQVDENPILERQRVEALQADINVPANRQDQEQQLSKQKSNEDISRTKKLSLKSKQLQATKSQFEKDEIGTENVKSRNETEADDISDGNNNNEEVIDEIELELSEEEDHDDLNRREDNFNMSSSKNNKKKSESKDYPYQTYDNAACDICDDNCAKNQLNQKELEELKDLERLCQYSKLKNISSSNWQEQQQSSNFSERFVLLTLMEPPSKSKNFISLHNIVRLVQSLDLNFPYKADHLILYDESTPLQMKLLQRTTHRKLIFVNVTSEFEPTTERQEHFRQRTKCQGDYSYRAMCRFASGPIYWMSILDDFDYFIRFDEDSYLTKKIQKPFVASLKQTNSVYGYVLEQPSSSRCRTGLNQAVVDFINQINHNQFNRPWMRLGDFKFSFQTSRGQKATANSTTTDHTDRVNVQAIIPKKKPLIDRTDQYYGSIALDKTKSVYLTYGTYNCNFEVVDLAYFRHVHYKLFWKYFDDRGLFFKTRMGDHEVKTTYLELFEENSKLVCFRNLPYFHPGLRGDWCRHNQQVDMASVFV